jgi:hypothetical protein
MFKKSLRVAGFIILVVLGLAAYLAFCLLLCQAMVLIIAFISSTQCLRIIFFVALVMFIIGLDVYFFQKSYFIKKNLTTRNY